MKKLSILFMIIAATMSFSACNDQVDDELYKQMISFKAPIDEAGDGVYSIYVRYKEGGEAEYQLPLIVSGTTKPTGDVVVHVAVDNDTLQQLNLERFPEARQDLWYRQLPEEYYSFPESVTIKGGSDTQNLPITFKNLQNLDLNEKWVLPITVVEDEAYETNRRKGRSKALLYLHLFNDYSGTYSAVGANIYVDGSTSDAATVDTRESRVVDENTIFFYAGSVWEEEEERHLYKVMAHFDTSTETPNNDGSVTGTLVLSPDATNNNEINLEPGQCTYVRSVVTHATIPYMERHITTLYINYKYDDITSDPENPMRYNVTGSMTMERQINTLIPDEDQAIQW